MWIADRFYEQLPDFLDGDSRLLDRMARQWKLTSAAANLPEFQNPMSADDYIKIQNQINAAP